MDSGVLCFEVFGNFGYTEGDVVHFLFEGSDCIGSLGLGVVEEREPLENWSTFGVLEGEFTGEDVIKVAFKLSELDGQ